MQRLTISLDEDLAREFDRLVEERGYLNRSEAVRDLLRRELAQQEIKTAKGHCVAVLSYAFDHHERSLARRMVERQHDHSGLVISTMHVHIDARRCAEAVVLRGPTARVRRLALSLGAETGVEHGAVNFIPLDGPAAGHDHHHHHQ